MQFAVNRYGLLPPIPLSDQPPLPGARIETRPFGNPPVETREIWIVEIGDLEQMLRQIYSLKVCMNVCLSDFWSGTNVSNPGERMFGIELIDEYDIPNDPRECPVAIGIG